MASKPNTPNPQAAADNRNSDKVLSLADQINDTCLAHARDDRTEVILRVDPANPGDHVLIVERLGLSHFVRQVRLPRINGKTWADRVEIDFNGWPVIIGIDPVSGGTVVMAISFSRYIPADQVEFYATIIAPDEADAVLEAMRLLKRAPKMQPFHQINSAESVARRIELAAKGPFGNSDIPAPECPTPTSRKVERPEDDELVIPGIF